MLKAMTNSSEWFECIGCSNKLAKFIFTKNGIVFELEGMKGQKSYFDSTFFITDCYKCHKRNTIIQYGGEEKFNNFDTQYLGGTTWRILNNPSLKKALLFKLTSTEKEILNEVELGSNNLNPDYWMVEAAQNIKMPIHIFMDKWSDIVNKMVELEKELKVDME